jgi:hypothetical protein
LTERSLRQIRTQLERMRALTRVQELLVCNERVSGWCPAEHLDHMARVAGSVVGVLADENAERRPGVTLMGRLVLLLGWIPRGVGKSPKRVLPTRASAEEINAALARVEQALDALPPAALSPSRGPIVPHPRFGGLTPPQALRLIAVHNEHHLKIVRDILPSKM